MINTIKRRGKPFGEGFERDMLNAKLTSRPAVVSACARCAAHEAATLAPEIPVTEEMIVAGERAWQQAREFAQIGTTSKCTEATYRAMAAVAPSRRGDEETPREMELRHSYYTEMCAELDAALKSAEDWQTAWEKERHFQMDLWKAKLAVATNECTILRDRLAAFTNAEPKPAVKEPPFLKALRSGNKAPVGVIDPASRLFR